MKKLILATVAISALTMGGAFAQSTGPSGQDTGRMMKNDNMKTDGMSKTTKPMKNNMKKGMTTGSGGAMQRSGTGASPSLNERNGTRSPAAAGDAGNGGGGGNGN